MPRTTTTAGDPANTNSVQAMKARGALDTADAALYTGFAVSTMKKWRHYGIGPRYAQVGSKVVYRVDDLDQFLAEHLVSA